MSQVIMIEDREEMRDLLSLNLDTYAKIEAVKKDNAEEAKEMLDLLPDVKVIICRDKIGSENTAKDIAEHIKLNEISTKIIVLGADPKVEGVEVISVPDPNPWKKVIDAASEILEININDTNKSSDNSDDYIPVSASYFLHLDTTCCDVFILIKKTGGEKQYVKLIQDGDVVTKHQIQGYIDKNLKDLFIPKDRQQNLANFISDRLSEKLTGQLSQHSTGSKENLELLSNAQEVASKEALKFGMTSATIQLVESIITSFIESIESSPEMSSLLRKVINTKGNYLYQKSHIVCIVSYEILKNMNKTNKKISSMLAYASFFHDIALSENEELSKITTQKDLDAANLSKEETELVQNHAAIAAEIIGKTDDVPKEVLDMIMHHHGNQYGKGFTIDFSKLSGLDKIFFISCEFVKELMNFKTDDKGKPIPVLASLKIKYVDPDISNVVKALGKTLKENSITK